MDRAIFIRPAHPDELGLAVAIDDDAGALYAEAGVNLGIGPEHPFARAEYARWDRALRDGHAFIAVDPGAGPVGMVILGLVDGAPFVHQLSVRREHMRRGLGRQLLQRAIDWAGRRPLWLTTYAHLPFNRPFYERAGFAVVPETECPPDIVAILADERRALPHPAERVAMRRAAAPVEQ